MRLAEAISAAGMTPPREFVEGKWLRFPGVGKGRSNRSGWCRMISPTLAIYGDWSSNLSAVWRDDSHVDSQEAAKALADARRRERVFAHAQFERQRQAAVEAEEMIRAARPAMHPYLAAKGFPGRLGLVSAEGELLIPVRAVEDYRRVLTVQRIAPDGTKRFLSGSRAKGGVHWLGTPNAARTLLCEGYATGLSLHLACDRLTGSHCVIVAFSAGNLELVAESFPSAVVMADNDPSATGEGAARRTGLRWTMPYEVGSDFNDLHVNVGLHAVVDRVREVFA